MNIPIRQAFIIMTNQSMKFVIYLLACSFLWITSCKNIDPIDSLPTDPTPADLVVATIYGKVIDRLGQPIRNAAVSYTSGLEMRRLKTDQDGYFLIKGAENIGKTAFLSITSPRRFEAFRRIALVENRNNYTEIQLMDRVIIGNIDAASGGTLSQADGAKIELPANAIVGSSGQSYSGKVEVSMAWVDPSAPDLAQQMVGDLSGIDAEGKLQALSTMGMLHVDLIGEDGSLLNLKAGALATLTFPFPSAVMHRAEAIIPLWSYQETDGIWMQEGEALLEGDRYVGEVSHFSIFNLDYIIDGTEITGQVKCSINQPNNQRGLIGCSKLQIYLGSDEIGQHGGWLCEDGTFHFLNFPKNEPFELKVLDLCNKTIFQATYGPLSGPKDLGELIIDDASNSMVSLTGKAVNCNKEPVSNGYVRISDGVHVNRYPLAADGTFELGYTRCELADLTVTVIDLDAAQSSDELTVNLNNPTFFDINVCNGLENFIAMDIEGLDNILLVEYNCYLTPAISNDSLAGIHSITYEGETPDSLPLFGALFAIPQNAASDPAFNQAKVPLIDFVVNYNGVNCVKLPLVDIIASFSEFAIVPGSVVKGTFSGTVGCSALDEGLNERQVSGSFSVLVK